MGNGKTLRIVARNNSDANMYIQSATLNGKPWNKPWFRHDDVKDGATFVFTMGPKPNKAWGASPGAAPPSMRSEEHTSELQSLMRISYAVFCLKKKKNTKSST